MSNASTPPLPGADDSVATPTATPLPRSRRNLLIIISIIAITICACAGIAAFTLGRNILAIPDEQAAITPVLDQFMRAMVANDVNGAYALFSSRAQRQIAIGELQGMGAGPNYVLFDGYQSLLIESTNIASIANTNPDVPQGQVATVNGTVTYDGEVTGSFRATLEKQAGAWRLDAINITVPPSKTLAAP